MPARTAAKTARRKVAKPRMGKGEKRYLSKILEEWLAEARIRYTYAGD